MKKDEKELSKRQVIWTFAAFWVHLLVSFVAMFLRPELSEAFLGLFTTTATLAGVVHVGYFGKAGVENYKKIERAFTGDKTTNDAEG